MDKYESITYLEIKGKGREILDRRSFYLIYEADDRNSFVYTQTRRVSRDGKGNNKLIELDDGSIVIIEA